MPQGSYHDLRKTFSRELTPSTLIAALHHVRSKYAGLNVIESFGITVGSKTFVQLSYVPGAFPCGKTSPYILIELFCISCCSGGAGGFGSATAVGATIEAIIIAAIVIANIFPILFTFFLITFLFLLFFIFFGIYT